MRSALAHHRFCAIGDAHPGEFEHRDVVRAVSDGHHLFEGNVLVLRNHAEECGFAFSVDDWRQNAARNRTVNDLQFVCVHVRRYRGAAEDDAQRR